MSQAMQKLYLIYLKYFCFLSQHYAAAYDTLAYLYMGLKVMFFWNLFVNSFMFFFILQLRNYIFPQIELWKTCVSDKKIWFFYVFWSLEIFNILELHLLRRNIKGMIAFCDM